MTVYNNYRINVATKDDVAELPFIKRAVQDTADGLKQYRNDTNELLSRRSIDQEAELKRIK